MKFPKLNKQQVEKHKPFTFKMGYMTYTCLITCGVFYYYVTSYGGIMPPVGSFKLFLADTWGWLTAGFLAPITSALVTGYFIKKRNRRNTDGK